MPHWYGTCLAGFGMFHKILAALDSSERASGVFEIAVEVARSSGGRLYIARAVTVPPEFPAAAAGSPADPLVARMAASAMQDVSRLIASVPDDVQVRPPIVRLGVPWRVILEIAEERDIDLIVVGSHGYHGWDHILGTTAAKIVNIAHRHVLVVHERQPGAGTGKREPSLEPSDPINDAN